MTIYNYDKHQDYKFEYKKDHILVNQLNKSEFISPCSKSAGFILV